MVVTFWMIVKHVRLATKLVNTCERCISPLTPQPPISPSQVLPYPPRRVGLNLPSSMNHPLLVFCPSIPCLTKKFTRNTPTPPKKIKVMSDEPQNRGNFFCPFLQSCYPSAFLWSQSFKFINTLFCLCINTYSQNTHEKVSIYNKFFIPFHLSIIMSIFTVFHRQLLQFPFQNPHPISPKYPLTPIEHSHIHFAPINQFFSPQISNLNCPTWLHQIPQFLIGQRRQELRTRD